MRRWPALLALLIGSATALPLLAARPFVTDDARVVDPGGCQIETFVKRQRDFQEREFWFLPACNPWGKVELTLGGIRVDSTLPGNSQTVIAQGKTLLKPLETNGLGLAATAGVGYVQPFQAPRVSSPYLNLIGSLSRWDDRVVFHANLGGLRDRQADRSRGTWGIGAEVLLIAPRLYGIIEEFGQSGDKPTVHGGLRFWLLLNRLQLDATFGRQHSAPPERRFGSVGVRVLW